MKNKINHVSLCLKFRKASSNKQAMICLFVCLPAKDFYVAASSIVFIYVVYGVCEPFWRYP